MKSDSDKTQNATGKRDSSLMSFRRIINASVESEEPHYLPYSVPPLLDAFHIVLLNVSIYLAYGYLIINFIDHSVSLRFQLGLVSINPVGLLLPVIFYWFTTYLTRLIIGKDKSGISSFWFSLINFFIVLVVNAVGFFFIIFNIISSPAKMPSMLVLIGPLLLFGGVFWNWGCMNFIVTPIANIRSGHRPVSISMVMFAKMVCFVMSILSLIPVLWFGWEFLKVL